MLLDIGDVKEELPTTVRRGVKLFVHGVGKPIFPENKGRYLPSGYAVHVALTAVDNLSAALTRELPLQRRFKRLMPPYNECVDKTPPEYFYNGLYTVEVFENSRNL